ncbi:hypothetical protein BYT27DRAFT_7216161 [Phlegmacium glaucopus]|nr:hypothetical protein BYT27DRAFT_7216161 [Phlegmacium glaucopus]
MVPLRMLPMLYLFHRRLRHRMRPEVSSFTDMLRAPPQVNQASQKEEDKGNEGKWEEKDEATLYGPSVSMIDSVAVALGTDGEQDFDGVEGGDSGRVVQVEIRAIIWILSEENRKRRRKRTDDVNSATLPPATDELSNENNLGNITPSTTPLESQNDETFHQLMNTTSLSISTLADRLM